MFPKIDSHSNIPANFKIFQKFPNSKIKKLKFKIFQNSKFLKDFKIFKKFQNDKIFKK